MPNVIRLGRDGAVAAITIDRPAEGNVLTLDMLRERTAVVFTDLFPSGVTRLQILVTFLAVLELVRTRMVQIHQAEHFGPIVLTLAVSADAPLPESLEQL